MNIPPIYDVLIIGGGLAGLTSAVLLSKSGLKVCVVEKHEYPFHRVCGEYVSKEALPILKALHIDLYSAGAVDINKFTLTSSKGGQLSVPLELGGIGISRYTLDYELYKKAASAGAIIIQKTNVLSIKKEVKYLVCTTNKDTYYAKVVVGSFGKRSNIDTALDRTYIKKRSPYIGIKYHVTIDLPDNEIALHNFKDGYAGISRIEDGKFCLCVMTTAANLKQYGSIASMEQQVFFQNSHLKYIYQNATFHLKKPLTIGEISFAPKSLIEEDILMCGDASGMITPLCGNGMAMAFRGAKMLSGLLIQYFNKHINKDELYQRYQNEWNMEFKHRLWLGRNIQKLFGNEQLTDLTVKFLKHTPFLTKQIIRRTHGKPF